MIKSDASDRTVLLRLGDGARACDFEQRLVPLAELPRAGERLEQGAAAERANISRPTYAARPSPSGSRTRSSLYRSVTKSALPISSVRYLRANSPDLRRSRTSDCCCVRPFRIASG